MRASHLGFTGADALKKVNVSIILPHEMTSCTGSTCHSAVFESCLIFTAPYDLFPYPHARSSCDTSRIARVKASGTNKLLWQKRSHRFGGNRCGSRPVYQPTFRGDILLLPKIPQADIDIISHHLLVVIALLVSIIVAITLYLIFLNVGKPYEPLPAENYKDPDEDVFTDSI